MENINQDQVVYFISSVDGDEIQTTTEVNTDQTINKPVNDNQTVLNYDDNVQVVIIGDINGDELVLMENEKFNNIAHNQDGDNNESYIHVEICEQNECHMSGDMDKNSLTKSSKNQVNEKVEALHENQSLNKDFVNIINNGDKLKDECRTTNYGHDVPDITVKTTEETIQNVPDLKTTENKHNIADLTVKAIENINGIPDLTVQTVENIQNSPDLTVKTNDKKMCKNCKEYYRCESSGKYNGLVVHTCIPKQNHEHISKATKTDRVYKCPACDREFATRSGKYKHYKRIHIDGYTDYNRKPKEFFCDHCNKYYDFQTYSKHREKITLDALKDSEVANNIKCLECNENYHNKSEFRRHLHEYHDLDMTPVTLTFPKIEAFYVWKRKIERETLTVFQRKVVGKTNCVPASYECNRSGKLYPSKKKELDPFRVTRKKSNRQGIFCTAAIYLKESSKGIAVTYYPVHYGHGQQMKIAKLSPEEEAAVDELTSQGMSYEKLISDLKGQDYVDDHHMFPIKKKYFRWVTSAYLSEDYATEKTDMECISEWVQKCCQLEEVPILLCQQENIGCENEKFILAIMTEFQKQIFLSSSKHVICVDTINRALDHHIIVVSVIDELNTAFPVAYCITNKLNTDVMMEFFTCIKESIGNLSPKYLISSYHNYIYESWVKVMGYSPVWLWSRWFIETVIRAHLRIFLKENASLKNEFFNILHVILGCKSKDVCECMFKNFIHRLETDEKTEKLAHWIMKNLGINKEKWTHCYQMEIGCETNINLELLHETFYKCGKMFKKRRLFALISVLMKVLRYKIIDRLLNLVDDVKLSLAVDAIDICHEKGMSISPNQICFLSDKLWKIESEDFDKVFVTQEMQTCPDLCNLKCKECNVCVHQFSCSCLHSIINANLCMHVHAVVFKFLGPFEDPTSLEIELKDDSLLENGNVSPLEEELSNSAQFTTDTPISEPPISSHKPNTSIAAVTPSRAPVTLDFLSEINIQKSNSTQTEPITCPPPQVIYMSPSQINGQKSISTQTEPLTYPQPQIIYISSSQINGQESISTQTEISVPTSEIITNFRQSNISNNILSHFASDISTIPNVISWTPTLNSEIPLLSTTTPLLNTTAPVFNSEIPFLVSGNSIENIKMSVLNAQTSSLGTQAAILNTGIPALNTQIPALNIQNSILNTQIPILYTQFPNLNTQTPALNIRTPFLNRHLPIWNTLAPGLSSQASIWNTQTPAFNTQIPALNTQTPALNTQALALNTQTPDLYTNTQTHISNKQIPVSYTQIPASNTQISVSVAQIAALNTQTTVSNTQTPVLNVGTSILDTETSTSCLDTQVLSKNTPALSKNTHTFNKDTLAFNKDTPVLREDISVLGKDTNSEASDTSLAKDISNPQESLLLESMEVHQIIQSSTLNEGTLDGITKHLNACLNIIKSSKNESLISPVQTIKSKTEGISKNNKTKLDPVPNRSLKRTASCSLDNNKKNKLPKKKNSKSSHLK